MPEIKDFPPGALTAEDVIAAQRPSTSGALGVTRDALAVALAPYVPISVTFAAATVTVSPFKRILRNGTVVSYAGGTIAVPSDGTRYLLHLPTNALSLVTAPWQSGTDPDAIVVAQVIRAGGVVTTVNRDFTFGGNMRGERNLNEIVSLTEARNNLGVSFNFTQGTAISGAGNTTLVVADANTDGIVQYTVNAAAAAYTHTISVSSTGAPNGTKATILLNMPSAAINSPTIEIRNQTSAGLLLTTTTAGVFSRTERIELVYTGSSWIIVSAGPEPHAGFAALAEVANNIVPTGAIKFDGTASRFAQCTLRGVDLGTGDYTLAMTLRVPTAAQLQLTNNGVFSINGVASGLGSMVQGLFQNQSSNFLIYQSDTGGTTGTGALISMAQWVGRTIQLGIVRKAGLLLVFVDGQPIPQLIQPSYFTQAVGANSGNTVLSIAGIQTTGYACFPERIQAVRLYNRALNGGELRALAARGVALEDRDAKGAIISPTLLNGGFETAGGGGADVFANWTEGTVGSSAVVRDVAITADGSSGSCRFDTDGSSNSVSVVQNVVESVRNYRISGKVRTNRPAGTAQLAISLNAAGAFYSLPATILPAQGFVDFAIEATSGNQVITGAGTFGLFRTSTEDAGFSRWFDSISLERIGCLVDLDCGMGSGYVLPDLQNRFPLVVNQSAYGNVAHIRQSMSGRFQAFLNSTTPTVIGGLPANARIMAVVMIPAAPVSARLGYSSGGVEVIAITPLEIGRNEPPLKTRYTNATGQLWVTLSSNVATDIVVIYDILPGPTVPGAGDNLPMGEQWGFIEAYSTADQTITTAEKTVTFNNVLISAGNGLSYATNSFTATRPGRIEFTVKAQVEHTTQSTVRVYITKNGNAVEYTGFTSTGTAGQERPCYASFTLVSTATVAAPDVYQIRTIGLAVGTNLNYEAKENPTPSAAVSSVTAQIALYKN